MRAAFAFLSALSFFIVHPQAQAEENPTSPIRHVIVILGENRTFDQVFATYTARKGQRVENLLSKGIVDRAGTPGPNFALAAQYAADLHGTYAISPKDKSRYVVLPPIMTDKAPSSASATEPPLTSLAMAKSIEWGIPEASVPLLFTGFTNQPPQTVDRRYPHATQMPDGPYPLTPAVPYDAYTANPVHRFYQMWQQEDCATRHATPDNPSGCDRDLFAWVEVAAGPGSNGLPRAVHFDDQTIGEGSASLDFYNMARGDAPYLRQLADTYTLADNYHQAVLGGTGANHIAIGTGDAIWFTDADGKAATPPANQIENPEPQPGTNDFYRQDGYHGGSYSACADPGQPGVGAIRDYLASLPYHPDPNCEPGHYYLLNNYAPGYLGNGTVNRRTPFVIPPSDLRTIGDALSERGVSWGYYGEGWNAYVKDPKSDLYCDICNPFQYVRSVMTHPEVRQAHLKDLVDFYAGISQGKLPAVAFVKPSAFNDGHPASSKLDLFEAFCRKLIEAVKAQPKLWSHTAILVTFDEGGGYYDSGYIQPLDFFGDGPRIPLIVISPYSRGGRVVHDYADHVSILKFIERNWGIAPLTHRSRDNLPNPVASSVSPYVPKNSPAIGDLATMFRFPSSAKP